jgi:hypothetical protein
MYFSEEMSSDAYNDGIIESSILMHIGGHPSLYIHYPAQM